MGWIDEAPEFNWRRNALCQGVDMSEHGDIFYADERDRMTVKEALEILQPLGIGREEMPRVRDSGLVSQLDVAKAVCGSCQVRSACLAVAMDVERTISMTRRHGIFGGLGPKERRDLSKGRR